MYAILNAGFASESCCSIRWKYGALQALYFHLCLICHMQLHVPTALVCNDAWIDANVGSIHVESMVLRHNQHLADILTLESGMLSCELKYWHYLIPFCPAKLPISG